MASNADISIRIRADLKQFSTQMQNAQRGLQKYGKQLQSVGTTLSVGLTAPLVAFGALALKNYDKQAKAIAQVNAGLKSTGGLVGFTTEQLQKQASALQENSLFGDEDILKDVTAQLLSFTNLAGEQFARTQQAALDLSTRLDGDLKSSAIQLGKALNDPVANLSALSRSGIQFSEDQKATINSLAKTNRLAEAQTIILNELEKQYGGSAEAAAKAGLGPLKQLANTLGDITEEFGAIILEYINPMISRIRELTAGFSDLSPETKKWIVILGGVAAAIGPLLALAGTILPAIGTGFALLASPIGAIVAALTAIGVIIYKNWEPIKKTLVDIANYFVDLYNESTAFRIVVEYIITTFKNLYAAGKFIFSTLGNIISRTGTAIKDTFTNMGEIIKAVLTGNLSKIPELLANNFSKSADNFGAFIANLKDDFGGLKEDITENISTGINNAMRGKYSTIETTVDTKPIEDKVAQAVATGLTKGGAGTSDLTPTVSRIDTSGLFSGEIVNPLGTVAEQLTKSTEDMQISLVKTSEGLTNFQLAASEVGASVGDVFANMTGRLVDSLGLADDGFDGFVKGLVSTITKLIAMLLSQSIASAIAGATASGTATGPAAVFTTPAFIATAIAGILGAFAAIPKFASGGFVPGSSFYGDKVLSGLNSGELVLNVAQQRNVANALRSGNEPIIVGGRIEASGDVLRVVLDRADKNRNRFT